MHIYHIASEADWRKAAENGAYRISTRGKTLDEQGFIVRMPHRQPHPGAGPTVAGSELPAGDRARRHRRGLQYRVVHDTGEPGPARGRTWR
jgi:hypothetical protein